MSNDSSYSESKVKSVTFRVKVVDTDITVVNQAIALEGENELETNIVTNPVPAPEPTPDPDPTPEPENPKTGVDSNLHLWIALLFISGNGMIGAGVYGTKRKETEET